MNRITLALLLFLLLPVSLALQDLLPAIPPYRERLQLLPVVFVFGAVALPLIPALWFALATGVVQGLAVLQMQGNEVEIGLMVPVVFFLGWALLLQLAGELARGIRWELHAFGSALVTLIMLAGQYAVICFKRGGFPLDASVAWRILVPSVAAFLIAPILYLALRSLVPLLPGDEPEERGIVR